MDTLAKVAAIHSEFKNSLAVSAIKTKDINEMKDEQEALTRLQNLGLSSSKTYHTLNNKVKSVGKEKQHNEIVEKLRQIEVQFPEYRLIGMKKVLELCEKYSLYVGMISDFIGTIPNKNAMALEKHMKALAEANIGVGVNDINSLLNEGYKYAGHTYIIAAPRKDFNPELTEIGRTLQNIAKPKLSLHFNMEVPNLMPDPIVMYPLNINGVCVFQIATAWGDEADDDYVSTKIKVENNNN